MSRRLNRAVIRWLSAEGVADRASEQALRRVFRALPAPGPSAGFTSRVLLAAGIAPPARATLPLAWRAAIGAALALAAAAVATAPPLALDLLRRITAGDVLRLLAGAVVETCQRLAEGLAVWQTFDSVGGTLADALSAPVVLNALLAATLISAGGLRMLHGLLAADRRPGNARA